MAEEVAAAIDAAPRAVAMLLNALTAMRLLRKVGDVFANTEESRLFLVRSSSEYVGYIIGHHPHLVNGWNQLDLGGGPGTYAIHFCRQNETLEAIVMDRSTTRPFAQEIIARFGLSERIVFRAGDYFTEVIPGSYDVAWLSHILHAESLESCAELLQKVCDAWTPGGLVLVHDFLLAESMDGPLFPALFSLNMLQGTAAGQAYSRVQIESMLRKAEFTDLSTVALARPNDSGVVAATK